MGDVGELHWREEGQCLGTAAFMFAHLLGSIAAGAFPISVLQGRESFNNFSAGSFKHDRTQSTGCFFVKYAIFRWASSAKIMTISSKVIA